MNVRALFLALSVVVCSGAHAQSPPQTVDPLGRSTPRSTVVNFLRAAHEGNYRRALDYLEPPARRETAEQLASVLDRTDSVDLNRISDAPEGVPDDFTDPDRERIGTVRTRERSLDLVLRRMTISGRRVWVFATSTLDRIPDIADDLRPSWIEAALPASVVGREWMGITLWRLFAGLLLLPVAAAIAWVASWVVLKIVDAATRRTPTTLDDALGSLMRGPLWLFIGVLLYHVGILFIGFGLLPRQRIGQLELMAVVFAICWFLVRLVDFASREAREVLVRTRRVAAISIVPLGRRIVKIAVLTIGVLIVLNNAGFDLRAVLTGLGVGGIAIALAAQRTLENVFGGIAIVLDQPVRVGDFCKFENNVGTVEDIGLRSTRVRTLDRTIISVPNGQFSTISIENFGPREKLWFHPVLRLRLDSTSDQIRYVLREIGALLSAHPHLEEGARIRFIGLAPDAMNLEVFAYVATADYGEFLAIQEDLLFQILRIIEQAGTSLATPTQTMFVARDHGLDRGRAAALAESDPDRPAANGRDDGLRAP
jgi:MscS family membrane protein